MADGADARAFQQIDRHADVLLLGLLAAVVDVGVLPGRGAGGVAGVSRPDRPEHGRRPLCRTPVRARWAAARLQKLARRTAQAALAFALPAVALFAVFGEWPAGDTVREASSLARIGPCLILALGQLANAGFGATGMLLNMTGRARTRRAVAVSAIVNVLLNLMLVPFSGCSARRPLRRRRWCFGACCALADRASAARGSRSSAF
ncbi:MAG: hypothetical protein U5L11_07845 [Arhodomonas sp.]|nr:hypothetical protein [Arhodomonas sp.]